MAIKVIVELRAKPGRRDELTRFVEKVVEELGPRMQEKGWLGSAFFEVPDDADVLVTSVLVHQVAPSTPAMAVVSSPNVSRALHDLGVDAGCPEKLGCLRRGFFHFAEALRVEGLFSVPLDELGSGYRRTLPALFG